MQSLRILSLAVVILSAPLLTACNTLMQKKAPIAGVAPNHPLVSITGRTHELAGGAVQFGYPGVTIAIHVDAKGATLNADSTTGNNYLDIYIDEQFQRSIKLEKKPRDYVLFSAERPQKHQIKIINRSESWHGLTTVHALRAQKGTFLAAPEKPNLKLLVIGDSVTCGEAVNRQPGCKKDPSWWDAHNSYGMTLGRALEAETHLVCYGGRGLVRAWDGSDEHPQAPEFYNMALPETYLDANWHPSKFQADVVLVSLGTNDFSSGIPEQKHFVDTYVQFATTLLQDHPQALIALTDGAILNDGAQNRKSVLQSYLTQVQTTIADERVVFIPSKNYPGDDCDAHPTGEQHANMAKDLEAQLRPLLQGH